MWLRCTLFIYICLVGLLSAEDLQGLKKDPVSVGYNPADQKVDVLHSRNSSSVSPLLGTREEKSVSQTNLLDSSNIGGQISPQRKTDVASSPAKKSDSAGKKEGVVPIEGGSVTPVENHKSDVASQLLDLAGVESPLQNKPSSIVPRKGASSKIKPRKGVPDPGNGDTESVETIDQSLKSDALDNGKMQHPTDTITANISTATSVPASSTLLSSNSTQQSEQFPSPVTNKSAFYTSTPTSVSSASTPKRRGKPDSTFDEDDLPRDANGNVLIGEEEEKALGSGPPRDYVVPVVIAMLAVPMLAVMGAVMYKKGRDFWERRHYRRMDFLIDGMYND